MALGCEPSSPGRIDQRTPLNFEEPACIDGSIAGCIWTGVAFIPIGGKFKSGAKAVGLGVRLSAKTDGYADNVVACLIHSFAPDTHVLMADGTTKQIKDVEVGDRVTATDPDTGTTTAKTVTATHTNRDTDLTDLTVTTDDGTTVINTTNRHPFYSDDRRAWVNAAALGTGESLHAIDATDVHVTAITTHRGTTTMYDLTIADIHTYYVVAGDTPVLAHNCGDAAKHSIDNLADSLDENVFFHYTDEAGHSGMMGSGVVRADGKGRSYFTQEMVPSGDALNVLFAANPQYAGRGSHVIAFRIDPARLRRGEQFNELIHTGSFRFRPEDVIYHGPDPFG